MPTEISGENQGSKEKWRARFETNGTVPCVTAGSADITFMGRQLLYQLKTVVKDTGQHGKALNAHRIPV
ncbi:hypothetical protein [Roseibium aggregatum]|uniref:Uncharacterized protein n=1 Tax=Roseibium aggregatum TaxID=187304 RepID=A0A939EIC2_9HYPH|nr:hypothetical protein [Roseibium aggregatum]MBN9673741.1 hypothetical protein [Roseibium aggregatum]